MYYRYPLIFSQFLGVLFSLCYDSCMSEVAVILAFLLEAFAVGAYSYAGFYLPVGVGLRLILGIVLPVGVMLFWGIFMAPKSKRRIALPLYRIVKMIIFGIAALLLLSIGKGVAAGIFLIVAILDEILLIIFVKGRTH